MSSQNAYILARQGLEKIQALHDKQPLRIINVCGGHERTVTFSGLRKLLPPTITLIPGPGCPVCVCPAEDIEAAIALSQQENITLLAFGDLLRVPIHTDQSSPRSLVEARASGGDVRPVASPLEVVKIARELPNRQVVFFAAGFETTMAPVAAMLLEGIPDNLSILLSGRLTWPAVATLLASGTPHFDALIAPGHVASVMGAEEWQFIPQRYHLPCAVAGFLPEEIIAAILAILTQKHQGIITLDNCYPHVVRPQGNPTAKKVLAQAFSVIDANWRGIGIIPQSGYQLQEAYSLYDTRQRYASLLTELTQSSPRGMPPGCDCAQVVLGKIQPPECRLYGKACRPQAPVGPCMVSDEGACHIWWQNGFRPQ